MDQIWNNISGLAELRLTAITSPCPLCLRGELIMPELPEVETMRRGILGIVGARIRDVERVACRRRPIAIAPRIDRFRRRAVGRTIREVGRVGKRVVVRLDSGDAIVLEPRMTGLVLVADPPSREHLRFRCTLAGNGIRELLYWDRRGLGSVRLFSPEEFEAAFGPAKLGPDALAMTAELFRAQLGRQPAGGEGGAAGPAGRGGHRQSVCVRDSAPGRRSSGPHAATDSRAPNGSAIADATHAVLETAIRYEGSTLGDGTYRNALNQAGGYQNHHRVYDRAGEACPRCGGGSADRADRAGPAVDVLLPGVSAKT